MPRIAYASSFSLASVDDIVDGIGASRPDATIVELEARTKHQLSSRKARDLLSRVSSLRTAVYVTAGRTMPFSTYDRIVRGTASRRWVDMARIGRASLRSADGIFAELGFLPGKNLEGPTDHGFAATDAFSEGAYYWDADGPVWPCDTPPLRGAPSVYLYDPISRFEGLQNESTPGMAFLSGGLLRCDDRSSRVVDGWSGRCYQMQRAIPLGTDRNMSYAIIDVLGRAVEVRRHMDIDTPINLAGRNFLRSMRKSLGGH